MEIKRLFGNRTGEIGVPETLVSFKLENNLLIFEFEAHDSSLNSYSNINNDTLCNGDVVEVFLDLNEKHYYEFEVAPNGATFVASIINAIPTFIENDFFKSDVTIKGNDYFVKMVIDLAKLKHTDNIRFNAFRIETKRIKPELILQALSPTLSKTFHVREKFINLK